MQTRRDAIKVGAGSLLAATLPVIGGTSPALAASTVNRLGAWRRGIDGQRRADLGDGHYLNPIFAGDHPDPTVLKDGADYYASFASADYYPGPMIWHSRDLLNWSPVGPVLTRPIGGIHGPELVRHGGRYFLYMAVTPLPWSAQADEAEQRADTAIFVVHAPSIHGPWSDPIDLGVRGRCDPGHVVGEDGKRYLFLDNGYRVQLAADGLSVMGKPTQVYQGWPIPTDFINEGFRLDAAKLIRRDGYFYLFAAEGGTAGPANGHLVSVARARSIDGPWENSPHNPLVRAEARDDPWWSRGRAVPVEGPDGHWWIIYQAYEKNLRSLGRQTILEPIEWGADGWPRALGGILDAPLPAPAPDGTSSHGTALSGGFAQDDFGKRFAFYRPRPDYMGRVKIADGALTLIGQGRSPSDSSPLAMIAGDRRYEIAVAIDPQGAVEAGLLLFYNDRLFCGLAAANGRLRRYKLGREMTYPVLDQSLEGPFHLKIIYKEDIANLYFSSSGKDWRRVMTLDVSGYNHNMSGDLLSLRPALFVAGQGAAKFEHLSYDGAL